MNVRWSLAVLLLAVAVPAHAEVYYGFQIGISNAPPPPVPVMVTRAEPKMAMVPNTRIYMVRDDSFRFDGDLFGCEGQWYVFRAGFWYRSKSMRGPFRVVDAREVPVGVLCVPDKHWKHPHGGPPGLEKQAAKHPGAKNAARNQVAKNEPGKRGHGKGRGH